nr:hypothetical protein Iba_chr07aCG9560 [Ipomoea batatas]
MTKGFTSVHRRFPVSPVVIVVTRSSPSPESGTTSSGPFIPFLNRFRKRFACLACMLLSVESDMILLCFVLKSSLPKMAAMDSTHIVVEGAPQISLMYRFVCVIVVTRSSPSRRNPALTSSGPFHPFLEQIPQRFACLACMLLAVESDMILLCFVYEYLWVLCGELCEN